MKLTGTKVTSKKIMKIDDLTIAKMMHGEREVRDELTRLEDQLEETLSRLHVRPENLLRVVEAALLLDHQPHLVGKPDKKSKSTVYEVPKLALGWSGSIQSLTTLLDRETQRYITFDPSVAEGRQDLVLVHLGHPLVQHSARILRAALWRKDSTLRRVTAVAIPGLKEPVIAALSRLVLVGKGGVRLHEEVFLAGIRVKGKALGEDASETLLEEYLDGKNLLSLSQKEQQEIVQQWNVGGSKAGLPDRLRETIALRKKKRLDEVKVLLTTREQEDVSRVSEIFDRFDELLKQSLEQAADDADFAEGQLFDEQKVQRAKDIAKWSQRREMLADERSRELEKVKRRYQEVEPYEFSAALVFAYPGEATK